MQIHVQNAPFVYNPDTISVGLGFSKGEKWLVEYSASKNISQCCMQFVFILTAPIYYIISKRQPLEEETVEGVALEENLIIFCMLACCICATVRCIHAFKRSENAFFPTRIWLFCLTLRNKRHCTLKACIICLIHSLQRQYPLSRTYI